MKTMEYGTVLIYLLSVSVVGIVVGVVGSLAIIFGGVLRSRVDASSVEIEAGQLDGLARRTGKAAAKRKRH
jgi:hypothetical protein